MIKIALTNLSKYNEGNLVFKWLELPATAEEIAEAKVAIGINEENEEWYISDYETDIEGLHISEYEDFNYINELAERFEDMSYDEQDAVGAVIEATGYSLEKALDIVEKGHYTLYTECDTLEDLAQELFDDGIFGDPKAMGILVNYINFASLGEDLRCNRHYETSYGVICVD